MDQQNNQKWEILEADIENSSSKTVSSNDSLQATSSTMSHDDSQIELLSIKKPINKTGIYMKKKLEREFMKQRKNISGMNILDAFTLIQKQIESNDTENVVDIDIVQQTDLIKPDVIATDPKTIDKSHEINKSLKKVEIRSDVIPKKSLLKEDINEQESETKIQMKKPNLSNSQRNTNKTRSNSTNERQRKPFKKDTKLPVKANEKNQSQRNPTPDRIMVKPALEINYKESEKEAKIAKFMDLCFKCEWAAAEQILRTYKTSYSFAEVNDKRTGETPLMLACKSNRSSLVNQLLDLNVDVNQCTKDGSTALHYAAKYSKEDIVKALLMKNADANIFGTVRENLPIHSACGRAQSSLPVVKCILNATRDGRLQIDKEGAIPLIYAIESGAITIMRELLEINRDQQLIAKLKHNGDAPIHVACRKKDVEALRLLCSNISLIDMENEFGQTALHVTADEGDENILKFLHAMHANPHLQDHLDRSPLYIAAEKGNTKMAEYLIDKFHCNVLTRDKNGNTLMHIASLSGHTETTMCLLKKGVPIHMPNKAGAVCLHTAAQKGHSNVVQALLEKHANVNAKTKSMYTPIHIAVLYDNPAVVEVLIGYGAQVNLKCGPMEQSPLHLAAERLGGETCAEKLLQSGANIDERMKNGETSLHISSRKGNLEMLKSLLKAGADMSLTCNDGNTSLHIAVRHCNFTIVNEMISFYSSHKSRTDVIAFINVANKEGETALHLAAEIKKKQIHSDFEDTDIIKLLLTFEGDMNIQTNLTQETPLHYCASSGNSDILLEIVNQLDLQIYLIVNKQAKNGWSPLLFASENGHDKIVSVLLKYNARVDVFDEHGMTALHLAAEKGHVDVLNVLLSNKAFVNAKSKSGLTPLHLASKNGHKEVVIILIRKYKAAIDAITLNKETPLHLAAENGQQAICEILLDDKRNPANPNAMDNKGQTPMHLAGQSNHSDVVKLFLKYDPKSVNQSLVNGIRCAHVAAAHGSLDVIKEIMKYNKSMIFGFKNQTTESNPLHLAAEGGHLEIVKVLVEAGALPNEENNDGQTCIHLAAKNGHIELLTYLKSKCNLTNVSQKTGMTALHVSAEHGQIEILMELLMTVPVNIRSRKPNTGDQIKDMATEWKFTALHLAAKNGHENIVRLLLNCEDLDIEPTTAIEESIPLHLAAQNGHISVTSLLLSKSSSQLSKKDSSGRSVLHLAASYGHLEMTLLLIGQGADINAYDNMKFTPLHFAAKSGHLPVVRCLVESGAISDLETEDLKIPLVLAAHFNHTDVMSFLLRQKHSTVILMSNSKFLYDLMICSKINDFKSLEEFVLLSPAPAETAAKLSKRYKEMSESEKERSKDLLLIGKYCENMCTDLVSLAAVDKGADKLLRSVDYRDVQFLDILIQSEQKEVISHPAIQGYLSDIWKGAVDWPVSKLVFLFLLFICCPFCWLAALYQPAKPFFYSPMIKFFNYLISHMYLIIILMYIAVFDTYPCDRVSPSITGQEILLLIVLLGQIVSEILNTADRKDIGILKIGTLVLSTAAICVHIYSFISSSNLPEIIYIRNQIFAVATFSSLIGLFDFLSIHHLFGPWTIIIRSLLADVIRFICAFLLFMAGFSCMSFACLMPPGSTGDEETVWGRFNMLYFSVFGLVPQNDKLNIKIGYAFVYSKIVIGFFLMINMTVLINLLIAMMTETYERIHEQADLEWKFGRSKLIRNIKITTPIPPPLLILSQAIYVGKMVYYKIRNLPIPLEEDIDDIVNEYVNRQFLKERLNDKMSYKKKDPVRIEDIVDWSIVVTKYLAIHKGSSGVASLDSNSDDVIENNDDD